MKVIPMELGLLGANCYILYCDESHKAAVIDPGGEGHRIIDEIEARGLRAQYILLTHGHFDHIGAVKFLRENLTASVVIHQDDADCLMDIHKNLSFSMGMDSIQIPPDILLQDNDSFNIGNITVEVIHTPGHSTGSICYSVPGAVFTGDTLFQGSVGRTDFPGGSYNKLISSIKNKLLVLEDHCIVYPGHGPKSSIGREKLSNPFLV